jgi:hypothetical protein
MPTKNDNIIEIKGQKFEVDRASLTKIETFHIGDSVKVLTKEYSNSWKSYPGVITGFDNFKDRPAINITYLKLGYSEAELCTLTYTENTENIDIALMTDTTELPWDKSRVMNLLDNDIKKKQNALEEAISKKAYFEEHFNHCFGDIE